MSREADLQRLADVNAAMSKLQATAETDGVLKGVNSLPKYIQELFPDWRAWRVNLTASHLSRLGVTNYEQVNTTTFRQSVDLTRSPITEVEFGIEPVETDESDDVDADEATTVQEPQDDLAAEVPSESSPEPSLPDEEQDASTVDLNELDLIEEGDGYDGEPMLLTHKELVQLVAEGVVKNAKLMDLSGRTQNENGELKQKIEELEAENKRLRQTIADQRVEMDRLSQPQKYRVPARLADYVRKLHPGRY